jgi:hypothetical protein
MLERTTPSANSNRLIGRFGKDKLITEITDDDVAQLVAWRRGQRIRNNALIGPFTVNATTKQLRKLFTRAEVRSCGTLSKWSRHRGLRSKRTPHMRTRNLRRRPATT